MKNALLILLSIFLLSGCSSFYHAQYRKLDKVDASGIRSFKQDSVRFAADKISSPLTSDGKSAAKKLLPAFRRTEQKKTESSFVANEKLRKPVAEQKPAGLISAKQIQQKRKADNHLGGLIPVFLLLLSILFLIWGISAFVAGIFLLSPVMMVAGLLLILVGGMPVLVQIRNAIAIRRNKNLYEAKH